MNASVVKSHYFLFVGGILGEFLSLPIAGRYFQTNINHIKDEFGSHNVGRYMPKTTMHSRVNAGELKRKVMEIHRETGKKVVLVCHSKGCQEALIMLLNNPDLVEKGIVRKAFLVQGSYLGSSLVDIMLKHKNEKGIVSNLSRYVMSKWPGLHSLAYGELEEYIQKKIAMLDDSDLDLVKSSIINVKSSEKCTRSTAWILKLTKKVLENSDMESDGLMPIEEQSIPLENVEEYTFRGDHSHHFTSWPITSSRRSHRKEFTNFIIEKSLFS